LFPNKKRELFRRNDNLYGYDTLLITLLLGKQFGTLIQPSIIYRTNLDIILNYKSEISP